MQNTSMRNRSFEGKRVALIVTASIAAYKALEVARLCVKAGLYVFPVMTKSAEKFVGPLSFSAICGQEIQKNMWDARYSGEQHVVLAGSVDAMLVVPATADFISKLACGRADDLASALILCRPSSCPLLFAPSMHPNMWSKQSTKRNVALLEEEGGLRLGPVYGPLASGQQGMGRMLEPSEMVERLLALLSSASPSPFSAHGLGQEQKEKEKERRTSGKLHEATFCSKELSGKRVLITAGPTYEAIDPVRYIGNRSSGKMGFALAECAAARGAEVLLVAGPVHLKSPSHPGVTRIDIESTEELRAILVGEREHVDVVVMAAAVADFRPKYPSVSKIKKSALGPEPSLSLVPNRDLLFELGQWKRKEGKKKPILVGFSLETGEDAEVIENARKKGLEKGLDLMIANQVHESLGRDDIRAFILSLYEKSEKPQEKVEVLGPYCFPKRELAELIFDRLVFS